MRQLQVLTAIDRSVRLRGYPPTIRELGDELGIASTNGVNDHLEALERKGLIERAPMRNRAMRITTAGRAALWGKAAA